MGKLFYELDNGETDIEISPYTAMLVSYLQFMIERGKARKIQEAVWDPDIRNLMMNMKMTKHAGGGTDDTEDV